MASPGNSTCAWSALLAYGFRPFFLLAGLHATLVIPLWLVYLFAATGLSPALPALAWHAHEMLFGFIAAALAGFLLTAIPSWTGQRGYAGAPLLLLALLWMAGRLVMTMPAGPGPVVVMVIDLAFLPALALTVLPALVRSGNRRNGVFIAILAALFAVNLHFHLAGATRVDTLMPAINVVLLMVALVGGRILPAFTASGLRQRGLDIQIKRFPLLDGAALLATFAVLLVDLLALPNPAAAGVAMLAAVLLALRLARWQGQRTLHDPILWVLHLAYAWLPLGLALKAGWLLGLPVPQASWIHALTSGAFSLMILGVMSRAALGHSGREIVAPGLVVVAYYLVAAAALLRVFGPLLLSDAWRSWMVASGVLWTLGFLLFVVVFAPILCRPRADGRPG